MSVQKITRDEPPDPKSPIWYSVMWIASGAGVLLVAASVLLACMGIEMRVFCGATSVLVAQCSGYQAIFSEVRG